MNFVFCLGPVPQLMRLLRLVPSSACLQTGDQTEEDKLKCIHSLLRGDALKTFKNITSPDRENLRETLTKTEV